MLDEDPVSRRTVARLLGYVGYETHEARTREEACGLVDSLEGAVHLLVCDLRPQGRDAAITLLGRHPDIRVLFMIGTDEASLRKELQAAEPAFLAKPFDAAALLRAVERSLATS